VGRNGESGEGGKEGGAHGRDCQGKHVVSTLVHEWRRDGGGPVKYSSVGKKNISTPIEKKHKNSTGRAGPGLKPPPHHLNTVGHQKPAAQIPLNTDPLVQDHNARIQQRAVDPEEAPILRVFPGLPQGQ
jgi:hypothetical protein